MAGGPAPGQPPPQRSWWRRNWKWFAGGVIGFIVGAVAGAGGEGGTSTETVASVKTVPTTVTQTHTETVTKTQTAPQTGPSNGGGGGGGGTQSFEGNGGKNLGTITVDAPSTLKWTNDGDLFQIFDEEGGITVNSQAHSGDTHVDSGTYHRVEVNAIGNWTIRITPTSS